MEKFFNRWCIQESDIGNTEPYEYTKSDVMDFARYYYHNKQLEIKEVNGGKITISIEEYEALKKDSEDLGKVSFSL